MSASKSVASLAVGLLVDDGVLALDMPASTWIPEWRRGPHAAITVRHLFSHTSGLDDSRTDFAVSDIASHAIGSPVVAKPGSLYKYNNNAVDLVGVVVGRAAKLPMDELLQQRLFDPMGVRAYWRVDRLGAPRAAGELVIRPTDLLKIGELILAGGMWEGKRLISEGWVEASLAPSQRFVPEHGLLWWREGRTEDVWGYAARGWLGQYLVVVPSHQLAGVRMRHPAWRDYEEGSAPRVYADFPGDLHALVSASASAGCP